MSHVRLRSPLGYPLIDGLIDQYFHRCHPSPGPPNYVSIGPSLACQPLEIEFFGHG